MYLLVTSVAYTHLKTNISSPRPLPAKPKSIFTMVARTSAILSLVLAVATAAPAIVWKSDDAALEKGAVYTSHEIKATDLLSELHGSSAGKLSVVFLLARGDSGSELLTTTAPLLEKVSEKRQSASFVHHHVSGIQSGARLVNDAVQRFPNNAPLLLNLQELGLKLNETSETEASVEMDGSSGGMLSKREFKQSKRARALAAASLLVVNVAADTSPDVLDAAVAHAIEHENVGTVVLSAVRSIDEVKQERTMAAKRRWLAQNSGTAATKQTAGHRRLEEDANGAAAENNAANNKDMTGVYYVAMTPNILAGLLFFGMFVTVTWIGISCMGMISGQDVYVKKMPSIGREA
jgi:hypothetical protein